MTCRDDVLAAFSSLEERHGYRGFTVAQIIAEVRAAGSPCQPSTISTHVRSRMCANAPDHHAVVYEDLERIQEGVYRRLRR